MWKCVVCGKVLGPIIDDDTFCECDVYEYDWIKVEEEKE